MECAHVDSKLPTNVKVLALFFIFTICGCIPSDPVIGTWTDGKRAFDLKSAGKLHYFDGSASASGTYKLDKDGVITITYTTDLRGRGGFVAGDPTVSSSTTTITGKMSPKKNSIVINGVSFQRRR